MQLSEDWPSFPGSTAIFPGVFRVALLDQVVSEQVFANAVRLNRCSLAMTALIGSSVYLVPVRELGFFTIHSDGEDW